MDMTSISLAQILLGILCALIFVWAIYKETTWRSDALWVERFVQLLADPKLDNYPIIGVCRRYVQNGHYETAVRNLRTNSYWLRRASPALHQFINQERTSYADERTNRAPAG